MNIAIIVAAGKGKRFGQLKQFTLLRNKPIILYSLKKFNQSKYIDKIIVVTLKSKIPYMKKLVNKYHLLKVTNIFAGGKERQDSVYNALKVLPNQGHVVIHDAVRPLFDTDLIKDGFTLVKKYKACIPVIVIQDTVKNIKAGKVHKTIDRSNLFYIQTPQFFNIEIIKKAYNRAYQKKYYTTDDASLVEKFGCPVYIIPGTKQNIKITDKEDLAMISKLI